MTNILLRHSESETGYDSDGSDSSVNTVKSVGGDGKFKGTVDVIFSVTLHLKKGCQIHYGTLRLKMIKISFFI